MTLLGLCLKDNLRIEDLSSEAIEALKKGLSLYSLKLISYNELRAQTKKWIQARSLSGIRKKFISSPEIFSFRIACLRSLQNGNDPNIEFSKACLDPEDIEWYWHVYEHVKDNEELIHNDYIQPVDWYKNQIKEILSSEIVSKAINFIAWRYLKVFYNSNRYHPVDGIQDLMIKANQILYSIIPFIKSPAHIINTIKQGVKRYAFRLIEYFTANTRRRIIETPDGYDNVVKNMDYILVSENGDFEEKYGLMESYDHINIDIKSIRKLLNPVKKKYFDILTLQYDSDFVKWYNTYYARKDPCYSTIGVFSRVKGASPERFIIVVKKFAAYNGIKGDKFDQFMNWLKEQ